MQNGQVCTTEISKDIALIIGPKLQLCYFHYIKSEEIGMVLWQYFEIWVEKKALYSGAIFQSGATIIMRFSLTQQFNKNVGGAKRKEQLNRKRSSLSCCSKIGCCAVFNDRKEYENHIRGNHYFTDEQINLQKIVFDRALYLK